MIDDQKFMSRALQLAALGRFSVAPNPMVGAVIVHDNKIIGEGYHKKYGDFHAEVNAIESVKNKDLLSKSTLYVTLEPCSHYGKTPPCAEKIIQSGIKKVVVAHIDPNPLVAGKGIDLLQKNSIGVVIGVMENEAKKLNKRFLMPFKNKRPFITLKWAQTKDQFIAREDFSSKWISNSLSRTIAHSLRAESQAILVGYNTVKFDNPSLNTRFWSGKNPIIFIIDLNNKLSDYQIIFRQKHTTCYKFSFFEGERNIVLNPDIDINSQIMEKLYELNIQSIMIEGGSKTIQSFINHNLWDEAWVFEGNKEFQSGIKAPIIEGKQIYLQKLLEDNWSIFANTSIN